MMRPIYFLAFFVFIAPAQILAQDPMAMSMRTTTWPETPASGEGLIWSVFSRQYFAVSNWNTAGLSMEYQSGPGQSTALICRDGIPGFSWYHLYVSHNRQFKKMSTMLQLRFSLIGLKNKPPVFRLGGNLQTIWSITETLLLNLTIYDFTGWIMPAPAFARGDPAMQFLLFNEPGRLIALAAGFQISRSQFGPVTAGVRMNINDTVKITGLINALPLGISIGVNWNLKGYSFSGWMEQQNGRGITPMMKISNKLRKS